MIHRMSRAAIALSIGLGLTWLASSQTRTATPARTVSPTRVIPNAALTPGTGIQPGPVISSTTPGYGSNLYSIPETTPSGMPAYSTTPTASAIGSIGSTGPMITATARRPMTAADCAQNGWQSYAGLGFTSQRVCETWVKRHPSAASRAIGARKPARTPTPR